MMKNLRSGIPNLFKSGTKQFSGLEETVLKNVDACKNLADITRTSFGPNGMNKMIINYLEKLFITSDAATIIKEMDVIHPAAKMVVLAAAMQEKEIGDGSNLVVIFAGELCQMAEELIHEGVHTKDIVRGYSMAVKKAIEILDDLVVRKESTIRNVDVLTRGIRCSIASKLYGYEEFLAPLVAKACFTAMPENSTKNFIVDNVRVCKVVGGQIFDSEVVSGMVIDSMVEGTIHKVENAKIGLFTCSIDASSTETKGTVLIHNAEELLQYNTGEEELLEKTIKGFADLGVNMLVSGSNIGDIALHFIEKYKMMALRVSSKFELRRICRTVRCRPLVQFGAFLTKEDLGFCSRVFVREVGGKKVTVFESSGSPVATILIRGSTQNIVDDVERAVDDGVNVVKAMSRDARFVAGGGATEIELARQLRLFGAQESSLAQYSINKFAEALEVVPRTLADSAGLNQTSIISDLITAHNSDEKEAQNIGVDIEKNSIGDMVSKNIIDLLPTKQTALKLATDAVVTILRVDQIIMAKQAGGPKIGEKPGHWDED